MVFFFFGAELFSRNKCIFYSLKTPAVRSIRLWRGGCFVGCLMRPWGVFWAVSCLYYYGPLCILAGSLAANPLALPRFLILIFSSTFSANA